MTTTAAKKTYRVIKTTTSTTTYEVIAESPEAAREAAYWRDSSQRPMQDADIVERAQAKTTISVEEDPAIRVHACGHLLRHHGPEGCNWGNCGCAARHP